MRALHMDFVADLQLGVGVAADGAVGDLADMKLEQRIARPVTSFATGEDVTLVIRDDGDGIPAEMLPRVFEPFVTTKEGQPDAGLGLHNCHQAVHRHAGQIRLRSKQGHGTKVMVILRAKGGTLI